MTPLSLRAGLLLLAAMWSSPLLADAVLSLGAGDRTLDIAPSGIADMDISESGGITDVFLRLMPGPSVAFAEFTGDAIGRTLVLRVCDTTLMEAIVRERIDTGTIYLAGTTMVRAEAMRALWHGRATCDTLDPEVFVHGQ
jgi:hypothetical protein